MRKGVLLLSSFGEIFTKISFLNIPHLGINDIVDIIGVAYLIYKVIAWIKDTRAWALFKGVIVIIAIAILANVFQLHTIWWILSNAVPVGAIAVLVLFQPEFRRALEQIGRGQFLASLSGFEGDKAQTILTTETIDAIAKATMQMAKVKTGALIVVEREIKLGDMERTGIPIDAVVTSQLLVNIFENNTPLHDGAVLIRNNRVSAATCFLPLSDNMEISKALGTRHRAAIGLSEISDAIIIVVSEETGTVSWVENGKITRGVDVETIKRKLSMTDIRRNENRFRFWKGRNKDE